MEKVKPGRRLDGLDADQEVLEICRTTRVVLHDERERPWLAAQLVDDELGQTLAAASSRELAADAFAKTDAAGEVGKLIAERAKAQGVKRVVFDRGGYKYHGRVKALAESARKEGLEF